MKFPDMTNIHDKIAKDAKLGNVVYCHVCGKTRGVDPGECLARGWPKCCDFTMSLDKPKAKSAIQSGLSREDK